MLFNTEFTKQLPKSYLHKIIKVLLLFVLWINGIALYIILYYY